MVYLSITIVQQLIDLQIAVQCAAVKLEIEATHLVWVKAFKLNCFYKGANKIIYLLTHRIRLRNMRSEFYCD